MYKLQKDNKIKHLTFSVFVDGSPDSKQFSTIKFGSFDQLGIEDGEVMQVFKTPNLNSWTLISGNVKFGEFLMLTGRTSGIPTSRDIIFELSVPYLYLPDYDFDAIQEYILTQWKQQTFQSISCDDNKCWINKNCADVNL